MVYKTIALPAELRRRQSQRVLYSRLNKSQNELDLSLNLAAQPFKELAHKAVPLLRDLFRRRGVHQFTYVAQFHHIFSKGRMSRSALVTRRDRVLLALS